MSMHDFKYEDNTWHCHLCVKGVPVIEAEIVESKPLAKNGPEDRLHTLLVELTELIGREKVRDLIIDCLGYGW